jgi:phage-related protein
MLKKFIIRDQLVMESTVLGDNHQAEKTQMQELLVVLHVQAVYDQLANVVDDVLFGLIVSNYVDKKTQPFFKYPLAPNN